MGLGLHPVAISDRAAASLPIRPTARPAPLPGRRGAAEADGARLGGRRAGPACTDASVHQAGPASPAAAAGGGLALAAAGPVPLAAARPLAAAGVHGPGGRGEGAGHAGADGLLGPCRPLWRHRRDGRRAPSLQRAQARPPCDNGGQRPHLADYVRSPDRRPFVAVWRLGGPTLPSSPRWRRWPSRWRPPLQRRRQRLS